MSGVFTWNAEGVESKLDQVSNVARLGIGGGGYRGHIVFDNVKGGILLLLGRRVLDTVGYKLMGDMSIQTGVGLSVWSIYWVREVILKLGRRNCTPCLRNQLFTKLVQSLLGVVCGPDPVSV